MSKKTTKANKRENGSGSLRQRADGTWEGRYVTGINPGTGKPIRKSIYGKKQADVAERLRKITSSIDAGEYLEPTKITVKQWFEVWLDEYVHGSVKPLTEKQYRSMSETHIFPGIGAVKLDKLSAPQLQKFYNKMLKEGRTISKKNPKTGKKETITEPLSAKTVRNIHGIISKSLNTAIRQGMLKRNVAELVELPRVEPKEIEPLSENAQKAFLKAVSNHRYNNLYRTIIFTGLREAEAIGLTWDCFDEKKGTLKVYRQLQKRTLKEGGYQFAALKNDKTRVIKLSPYVISILKEQQKAQENKNIKSIFIFSDDEGKHLSVDTVYGNFKRIANSIGIPTARVHDLRHTFAVISLQEGDDLKTVQENLGHATAAFTLDVYGHVSEKMKEESAKRQQAYIEALGI